MYTLTTLGAGPPLTFEAFSWAPRTGDAVEPGRPTHGWSWKSVAAPPPPFALEAIMSYAVHPDGRTVFVSTATRAAHGSRRGTHSFDTTRREWRCHGDWVLPFHGQGFFDRELDAWVGLDEEQGCVCACQVASRSTISIVPHCPRSRTGWRRSCSARRAREHALGGHARVHGRQQVLPRGERDSRPRGGCWARERSRRSCDRVWPQVRSEGEAENYESPNQ